MTAAVGPNPIARSVPRPLCSSAPWSGSGVLHAVHPDSSIGLRVGAGKPLVDQRLELVDLSRLQLRISGRKCGKESDAEPFGERAVDKSAGPIRVPSGSNGVADAVLLHIGQLRNCESDKLLDPAAVM
jgi:hypothetical protein